MLTNPQSRARGLHTLSLKTNAYLFPAGSKSAAATDLDYGASVQRGSPQRLSARVQFLAAATPKTKIDANTVYVRYLTDFSLQGG
jgi:hypothetical protein